MNLHSICGSCLAISCLCSFDFCWLLLLRQCTDPEQSHIAPSKSRTYAQSLKTNISSTESSRVMACAPELDLREGYEIYDKMVLAGSPIIDHRPVPEIKIATSLSLGLHMAESAAQKVIGCGVLEAFEVYFCVGGADKTQGGLHRAKRAWRLPHSNLEPLWGPVHPRTKESLRKVVEKNMAEACADAPTRPMAIGPLGSTQMFLLIVPKGTCNWCEKPGSTKSCPCGCAYCSKDCQKKHWPTHKRLEH